MKHKSHLSDRELIIAMDGELSARQAHQVEAHLGACWTCRSRKMELERAMGDFVHVHRLQCQRPPSQGSQALLKARLAQAAQSEPLAWWRSVTFRRSASLAVAVCGLLAILTTANWRMPGRHAAMAFAAPDPVLTPGAAVLQTSSELCRESKPKNKEIDPVLRRRVFDEYGLSDAPARIYEVDYLITPALGGADDIRNLWPQSYGNTEWNATVKDALEDRLRDLVCQGQVDLPTAQREIASNWIEAYKKYFHTDHPLRSHN